MLFNSPNWPNKGKRKFSTQELLYLALINYLVCWRKCMLSHFLKWNTINTYILHVNFEIQSYSESKLGKQYSTICSMVFSIGIWVSIFNHFVISLARFGNTNVNISYLESCRVLCCNVQKPWWKCLPTSLYSTSLRYQL